MSTEYADAGKVSQKTAAIAAASYPAPMLDSNALFVDNSLTLAVGFSLPVTSY
jgi:hypothetical protein